MMTMSLCGAAALLWMQGGAAGETFAQAAARSVSAMADEGSRTVLAPGLNDADRRRDLADILARCFDLPAIARQALGYHWTAADAEQRREFTALYGTMLTESYADVLRTELGLPFTVTGQRDEGPRDALVLSQLGQRTDPGFLRIDWRMRLDGEGTPRIIDVIVSGVSLVRSGQDDFDAAIRASGQGMEGLLKLLRARHAAADK